MRIYAIKFTIVSPEMGMPEPHCRCSQFKCICPNVLALCASSTLAQVL